ncbi:hypothetical protein XH96_33880 [Bradyrhizobium sp. CCBAU 51765]|nr:hypothetical protein XH96_33880 [Bradyrhizobium sp. CCBAU 51765]
MHSKPIGALVDSRELVADCNDIKVVSYILVLRATDDEANLALIGGSIGAKLFNLLIFLAYPVLLLGVLVTAIPVIGWFTFFVASIFILQR